MSNVKYWPQGLSPAPPLVPLNTQGSGILFLIPTFSDKVFHLSRVFLDFQPIPKEMLNIWVKTAFFGDFNNQIALLYCSKLSPKHERKRQKRHMKSVSRWKKEECLNRRKVKPKAYKGSCL